jgi:hypothetical protein
MEKASFITASFVDISLQSIGFLPNLQILEHIDHGFQQVTVRAQLLAASVACTGCGAPSSDAASSTCCRTVAPIHWRRGWRVILERHHRDLCEAARAAARTGGHRNARVGLAGPRAAAAHDAAAVVYRAGAPRRPLRRSQAPARAGDVRPSGGPRARRRAQDSAALTAPASGAPRTRCEPWSTGPVEGHINRLKAIKRDMYGRAGFELLCGRILGRA